MRWIYFVPLALSAGACTCGTEPPGSSSARGGSPPDEAPSASAASTGTSIARPVEAAPAVAPERLAVLTARFVSAEWPDVRSAQEELLALGERSLPALGALLDAPRLVPLEHTNDLIYPGAKQFHGRGRVVDYDIDWTHVRAGWLLETLTFQGFGFRGEVVRDGRKLRARDAGPADFPTAAVAAAHSWLASHGTGWTRLSGLREALDSVDPERQAMAVAWLRSPRNVIRGFTTAFYDADLDPIVQRLATTDSDVGRDAKRLVKEAADPSWRARMARLAAAP